jgi:hypothetical protein
MAAVVLRVPIESHGQEYVDFEVDYRDVDDTGVELIADGGNRIYQATTALGESMDRLVPALAAILRRLTAGPHAPDQLAMNLSLKLNGEGSLIVARGGAEAALAITMTWQRSSAAYGEARG